jgi:DNA mismatch repair protein MutL
MSSIINILPDHVANQIAAGEVVQRPASVVKELLENSVDSGAHQIQLIVKDAGKTLIQVIDNGKGMTDLDARICFERHATSKLKSADDLFALKTKGFRGEALASIAAIAQVELKTRHESSEIGTSVFNEGCQIKEQFPLAWQKGTSIAVKNLFFNVPARRNFLKSDNIEFGHILEEFTRVSLAHPEIEFILNNNGQQSYFLGKTNLKQRIVSLLGSPYQNRLVSVNTETSVVIANGFIGKPEYAKKKRGEQYLFVNGRFIKNNYLNHAIIGAYEGLLQFDTVPSFFIFIEVDPKTIDVNIHPTKTEVKFEDEKTIYTILRSVVKMAIGQNNISPSLDFETETSIELPIYQSGKIIDEPKINVNTSYNPFNSSNSKDSNSFSVPSFKSGALNKHARTENWESIYDIVKNKEQEESKQIALIETQEVKETETLTNCFQFQGRFIVSSLKSGLVLIDQSLAHKRILYERFLNQISEKPLPSQQLLFPFNLALNLSEHGLLIDNNDLLARFGFSLSPFGGTTISVQGVPVFMQEQDAEFALQQIINDLKENASEIKNRGAHLIALSLCNSQAIKPGKILNHDQMVNMLGELFSCTTPYSSPAGKPITVTITTEELLKRFSSYSHE